MHVRRRHQANLGKFVWVIVCGVLIGLSGWLVDALTADDTQLQRIADQSQVIGVVLAGGTALVTLAGYIQRRLATDQGVTDWAAELAHRVSREEERNRRDLLGGVDAADVTIGEAGFEEVDDLRQRLAGSHTSLHIQLSGLRKYYDDLGGNGRLVVLGEPGSGKTVAAVELIVRLLGKDPEPRRVPVRFNLAGWDPTQQVEEWFAERLTRDYGVPPAWAAILVQRQRVLPVLDGLDEMDPDISKGRPVRAIAIMSWLNLQHTAGGELAGAIVTCRSKRYAELASYNSKLRNARELKVVELEPGQIRRYITKTFNSDRYMLASWGPVLDALDRPGSEPIWAVLSSPWRLKLATTLVRAGRQPTVLLSPKLGESTAEASERIHSDLLSNYVESATKLTQSSSVVAERSTQDVTRWLSVLARSLQRSSKSVDQSFSAVDIVPYRLFDTDRSVRWLHALTAGSVMALGCFLLALDGIGSIGTWADNVRKFFTADYGIAYRLFQEILPVLFLAGAPLFAARLAFSAPPDPISRMRSEAEFKKRFIRSIELASPGVVVALLALFFFFDLDPLRLWEWEPYSWMDYEWVTLAQVIVLFSLMAGYVLTRQYCRRIFWLIAFAATALVPLSPLLLEVVDSQMSRDERPKLTVALGYLLTIAIAWVLVLALVGRNILKLREAAVAKLHLSGRARGVALVASLALPALATWLFTVLHSGSQEKYLVAGLGPVQVIFEPQWFGALGVGAGVVAGVNAAIRGPLGSGVLVGFITGLSVGAVYTIDLEVSSQAAGLFLVALYLVQALICLSCAALLISVLLRDSVMTGVEKRLPQVVLRDDLLTTAIASVVISAPILLAFLAGLGEVVGIPYVDPWGAVCIGISTALAFGPLGRRSWFRYRAGAALASARGELPWRLDAFLNWAVHAGLLRVNGSTYQFRHLELQQWLLREGSTKNLPTASVTSAPTEPPASSDSLR